MGIYALPSDDHPSMLFTYYQDEKLVVKVIGYNKTLFDRVLVSEDAAIYLLVGVENSLFDFIDLYINFKKGEYFNTYETT